MPRLFSVSGLAWHFGWKYRRHLFGLSKNLVGGASAGLGSLMLLARGRAPLTTVYLSGIELHIEGGLPGSACRALHPYLTFVVIKGRSGNEGAHRFQTATLRKDNHCRRGALFHNVFKVKCHPEEGDAVEVALWHNRSFFAPVKLATGRLSLSSFGQPSSAATASNRQQEMSAWVPLLLEPHLLAEAGGVAESGAVPAAATVRLKLSAVQPAVVVPAAGAAGGRNRASSLPLPPPTYLPDPPSDVPLASLAPTYGAASSGPSDAGPMPVATVPGVPAASAAPGPALATTAATTTVNTGGY